MSVIGIDPGTVGAFAILDNAGIGVVDDLPVHKIGRGWTKRLRAELDLNAFAAVLQDHHLDHACLERVTARPGQGVVSMFRFGQAAGALYGLLVGLSVPVTFVLPQTWQRHHGIGPSPDAAARHRAVPLYPATATRLALKRDANRADALLLADYGLRRRSGSPDSSSDVAVRDAA
jgi:crossover junction endodeoxyribonuclease RuvC